MNSYVEGIKVQTYIHDHFAYQHRIGLRDKRRDLIVEARIWAAEQFGPNARTRIGDSSIINSVNRWTQFGSTFFFHDIDDAFWFKVRWA